MLRSVSGAICRIRHSIPSDYYKNLYSALFESHLSFGISVWGVALKPQPSEKLFVTQKHCIRVLFGDLNAYLEKYATCARVREFGYQKLGANFYTKEHTKPLFNKLKILTAQNLFTYCCISEIYKILMFRTPYSLYQLINLSKRDSSNLIILPQYSKTFLYEASKLWNAIHKCLIKPENGFATSIFLVKNRVKSIILK